MRDLKRDQLIMRLRHSGQTYAQIGSHPEVGLGERQVQRIVKDMEMSRTRAIERLTEPADSLNPDVDVAERIPELIDSMTEAFASLADLASRYDVEFRRALKLGFAGHRFRRNAAELRALADTLLETSNTTFRT